jgi:hypothetical protein
MSISAGNFYSLFTQIVSRNGTQQQHGACHYSSVPIVDIRTFQFDVLQLIYDFTDHISRRR